jgi:hypothetical protein
MADRDATEMTVAMVDGDATAMADGNGNEDGQLRWQW